MYNSIEYTVTSFNTFPVFLMGFRVARLGMLPEVSNRAVGGLYVLQWIRLRVPVRDIADCEL